MYSKILVPLDGSELAETSIKYAKGVAHTLNLDIDMIYVQNPYTYGENPNLEWQGYIENKALLLQHELDETRKNKKVCVEHKKVNVSGELIVGHPAERILSYANEKNVDFILMTTHGRSGVRRWVMGSVADKVLRAAKIPIWLVRTSVSHEITYEEKLRRTIMVLLDGSELAETVLPHVETLVKQYGTDLINVLLFRVGEPPSILTYDEYLPEAPEIYARVEAAEKAMAEKYLAKVKKKLTKVGLVVHSEMLLGSPEEEIVNYANTNPVDLIVMSTHARSGFSRWAYGSVAAKVLHGVNSPIFLVRPSTARK